MMAPDEPEKTAMLAAPAAIRGEAIVPFLGNRRLSIVASLLAIAACLYTYGPIAPKLMALLSPPQEDQTLADNEIVNMTDMTDNSATPVAKPPATIKISRPATRKRAIDVNKRTHPNGPPPATPPQVPDTVPKDGVSTPSSNRSETVPSPEADTVDLNQLAADAKIFEQATMRRRAERNEAGSSVPTQSPSINPEATNPDLPR